MITVHKAELFVLSLSFFGWILLSALTMGIGLLWVNPYMCASYAAFYRNISRPAVLNSPEDLAGISDVSRETFPGESTTEVKNGKIDPRPYR